RTITHDAVERARHVREPALVDEVHALTGAVHHDREDLAALFDVQHRSRRGALRSDRRRGRRLRRAQLAHDILWRTMAEPWPPPTQRLASPISSPERASSWTSVATRRAPVAPMGWPSAIAPPFGLRRAGSIWPTALARPRCSRANPSDASDSRHAMT